MRKEAPFFLLLVGLILNGKYTKRFRTTISFKLF